MFLAFFPSLLVAPGLISSSLSGKNGQELAVPLSEILPPGSWQLISDFLVRVEKSTLGSGCFSAGLGPCSSVHR
jgi:membrane protein